MLGTSACWYAYNYEFNVLSWKCYILHVLNFAFWIQRTKETKITTRQNVYKLKKLLFALQMPASSGVIHSPPTLPSSTYHGYNGRSLSVNGSPPAPHRGSLPSPQSTYRWAILSLYTTDARCLSAEVPPPRTEEVCPPHSLHTGELFCLCIQRTLAVCQRKSPGPTQRKSALPTIFI